MQVVTLVLTFYGLRDVAAEPAGAHLGADLLRQLFRQRHGVLLRCHTRHHAVERAACGSELEQDLADVGAGRAAVDGEGVEVAVEVLGAERTVYLMYGRSDYIPPNN